VETAKVTVGEPAVLVDMTGTVGGLRIAAWVKLASTVCAAAVKTASAPWVGVASAFEGKLQADIPNIRINRIEASRVVLSILSSSIIVSLNINNIVSQAGENFIVFVPPKMVNQDRSLCDSCFVLISDIFSLIAALITF
jgi:hypothetical protein